MLMELSPKPVIDLPLLPKSLFAKIHRTMSDWWQTGMARVHRREWIRPLVGFLEVNKDKPPLHQSKKMLLHLGKSWIRRLWK